MSAQSDASPSTVISASAALIVRAPPSPWLSLGDDDVLVQAVTTNAMTATVASRPVRSDLTFSLLFAHSQTGG